MIIHDTCHFSPEWEQLAPVSGLFDRAEQLSMRGAGGHRVRHGASSGDGETLNPHHGPSKDKYGLRTVLITSLN